MSDSESAQEHQLTMVIKGNSATDLFITEKSKPPRTIIYVSESTWNHRSLVYKSRTDWKYNKWCNRVNLNHARNPTHNAKLPKQAPVDSLNFNNRLFEPAIVPKYRGHHHLQGFLRKGRYGSLAPGHNHPSMHFLGNTFEYKNANPIYTCPITALLSSSVLLVTARIHILGMCNLGVLSEQLVFCAES
jgi:hypothetical protein